MKFNKTFDKALWVFHLNTGSCNGCDIEIVAALTPRYDVERFGLKLVGSPRHADVLLMTGPVTRAMAPRVERIYNQTPDPKVVMVIGNCGCSTGGSNDASRWSVSSISSSASSSRKRPSMSNGTRRSSTFSITGALPAGPRGPIRCDSWVRSF